MFIIGERINPAGKADLSRAIREGKKTLIQQEAIAQERAGAQALDINVYLPDVERTQAIRIVAEGVRAVSRLRLAIDDREADVVESGLRHGGSDALINSPIDPDQVNTKIFSLAEQFNSEMIILPLKANRIPADPEEHLEISRRTLKRLEGFGISKDRVVIDAVLLALKQAKERAMNTLETIKRLKADLGVRTVIGLSNLSYGLKRRQELNARFLRLAKGCGLDVVICDPLQEEVMAAAKGAAEPSARSEEKQFLEFAETCWA